MKSVEVSQPRIEAEAAVVNEFTPTYTIPETKPETKEVIEVVTLSDANTSLVTEVETSDEFANLGQTLLNITSEKTGYPVEMLEFEMDMEADLGIDSIKRVEILGAMQEMYPNLPKPNIEELADLRTIGQIVDYLQKLVGGEKKSLSLIP